MVDGKSFISPEIAAIDLVFGYNKFRVKGLCKTSMLNFHSTLLRLGMTLGSHLKRQVHKLPPSRGTLWPTGQAPASAKAMAGKPGKLQDPTSQRMSAGSRLPGYYLRGSMN